MSTQASRIEQRLAPISSQQLKTLGGVLEELVWKFADGSRGRMLTKPIAVYDDNFEIIGFVHFEETYLPN
jgi:hypothetical protein